MRFVFARAAVAVALVPSLAAQKSRVIDDFSSLAAWTSAPSDGVSLQLVPAAGAMRMDVDFHGGGGYAVARRAVDLELPDNYEITFRVRGTIPRNNLEFKLIDSTGENVWWINRRDFAFPRTWSTYRIKRRQISFAWGPRGGGDLARAAAIEIAITAGNGGKGSVWIDDLRLTPLPPVPANPPAPVAVAAPAAVDNDTATTWRSRAVAAPSLTLDLGYRREFGGLVIDWDSLDFARAYDVQGSNDDRTWRTLRRVARSNGGRDWLYMPESEAQWVRIVRPESWCETLPRSSATNSGRWQGDERFSGRRSRAVRCSEGGAVRVLISCFRPSVMSITTIAARGWHPSRVPRSRPRSRAGFLSNSHGEHVHVGPPTR